MDLEAIQEHHREKVFRVMELCNIDLQQAYLLLDKNNYDETKAVNEYFNPQLQQPRVFTEQLMPMQNYAMLHQQQIMNMQNQIDILDQDDQQDPQYLAYRRFRDRGIKFQDRYRYEAPISRLLFSWVPTSIRGEHPGGQEFISKIDGMFGQNNLINFCKGTFVENLLAVKRQKIPMLVYLIGFESYIKQTLASIVTNQGLCKYLNEGFVNLGLDVRNYQMEKQLKQLVDVKNDCPCIIVVRLNEINDIIMLDKIFLQRAFELSEFRKKLTVCKSFAIRGQMKETEFMKKYEGQIRGIKKNVVSFEKRLQFQEQRKLRKQQEKELAESIDAERKLLQKQSEISKYKSNETKKLSQTKQQLKQKSEEQIIHNIKPTERVLTRRQQLRKRIPEFKQGINFKIRLPSGDYHKKMISKSQKIGILFDIIESLEECGFDNDNQRKFDIMRPYDRLALSIHKQRTLGEMFGDSDSENLIVNQLAK